MILLSTFYQNLNKTVEVIAKNSNVCFVFLASIPNFELKKMNYLEIWSNYVYKQTLVLINLFVWAVRICTNNIIPKTTFAVSENLKTNIFMKK